jgi:hypothetical protein
MKYFLKTYLLYLIAPVILFNCNSDATSSGTSGITVKMVDNPGDFDNVFVEVVDVMVKYQNSSDENQDEESGWQSLELINSGVYDLLELTGGVELLLVDNFDVPSGSLQQIRLILGDNNTIVIDGETYPLMTPSAQQSGLKVQINQELEPDFNYTFILDFDAHQSIVMAGNSGNIILKPVLRASLEVSSGTITGTVLPAYVAVLVTATNGTIETSTFTDDLGNFMIAGLPEGTYSLTFTPDEASLLNEQSLTDVSVLAGEVTDVGTTELE